MEGLPAEIKDHLPTGPVRGRGACINPGNRFETVRLHVLGEHLDGQLREHPCGRQVRTQVFEDDTRSILNRVDSPDLGFNWTVNPYRGCEHGCIYCYARPGHEYLALSSGLDFETRIFAKPEAPRLLREALSRASWQGEPIVFSGVTDCYQPIEAGLAITRACLEVCAEFAQPVSIVTKNKLVLRDRDILEQLAAHNAASVAVSITSLDNALASKMEPRASAPRERLEAIRQLAAAGIPTHVMVAPIIPALNEPEVAAILSAAAGAGARDAGYILLRLPHQIKALFEEWLGRHYPDRAARVLNALRDMHGGELYNADFFHRQRGAGPRAEQIGAAFRLFKRRAGLGRDGERLAGDRRAGGWAALCSAEFLRRRSLNISRAHRGQLGLFG
ncbi:MAG: PA0069 family radical SAM protein [Phycisphaeraceae bacterium]|nr:PA0069 family radical SAM protein [Phycisphaeraceae bacterium]